MRKKVVILMIATCLLLTGCTNSNTRDNTLGTNSIDKVLNELTTTLSDEDATTMQETTTETLVAGELIEVPTASDESIDYDLTEMGSDMVYATVSQIMYKPENYVGKIMKISGMYYATYYEPTQKYYFAVIIADALGCCSQGIEFVWGDGSHVYPDEYPPDETEVEVIGRFETYTEEGSDILYCRLADAEFNVITN